MHLAAERYASEDLLFARGTVRTVGAVADTHVEVSVTEARDLALALIELADLVDAADN
jgi:hypothetical protein